MTEAEKLIGELRAMVEHDASLGLKTSLHAKIRAALDTIDAALSENDRLTAELADIKTSAENWKESHSRVVEGFMEVCEAVGVQFDAPEAVAYAINTKVANVEYDKRSAEAKNDRLVTRLRDTEASAELRLSLLFDANEQLETLRAALWQPIAPPLPDRSEP